ncbi:MAG: hypothetical protein ABR964_11425 [Tepidisphaeraceae bacterium]|jgi:hypothetical protein
MTRQFPDAPQKVQPLDYAGARLKRRSPLVTTTGILSICVGCFSLLVNGLLLLVAVVSMSELTKKFAAEKQQAVTNAAQAAAATRTAATRPAPRALTENEIADVIRYIQERSHVGRLQSGPLSSAQIKALTRMLAAPGQLIIDPQIPLGSEDENGIGYQLVQQVFFFPDGALYLDITHGSRALGRTRVQSQIDLGGTELETDLTTPADSYRMAAKAFGGPQWTGWYQDRFDSAMFASIIVAINLALALLLLVAAVLLLRSKPRGVQFHQLYAWLQLPASIGWGIALIRIVHGLSKGMLPISYGAMPALGSCAYPLLLIAVLRHKSFQEHQRNEMR